LIVPLFYGQSISQVVCADCGKIWHNYEVFQDLSVAITASTLEGCIANNFEDVRLTDWKCDKCGKGGRASVKTNMLWKVPRVLMVTLKRFDAQGRKDGRRIAVPEVLQLDDYVLGSKAKKRYMLQSVGIHSGSFFGGHYRALCRANSSTWLVIDDESVHTIREWTHAASDGYCFFYLGIDQ
jgi:ubiquitin C-terminal hydrolase